MITRHTPANPTAHGSIHIRPIFDYAEHFDVEADKAAFLEKHGGTGSTVKSDDRSLARKLRREGKTFKEIGLAMGVSKERAHALVSPKFERQLTERLRRNRRRQTERQRAA